MNDKIQISRFNLKQRSHACDKARAFAGCEIIEEKSEKYDRAIGMLDIFNAIIWDRTVDPEDLFSLCSQITGYEDSLAASPDGGTKFDAQMQALKNRTLQMAHRYRRYVRDEMARNRTNYMRTCNLPELPIEIGNYVVPTRPQFLTVEPLPAINSIGVEAGFYADKAAPAGVRRDIDVVSEVEKFDDATIRSGGKVEPLDWKRLAVVPRYLDEYCALRYIQELLKLPEYRAVLNIPEGTVVNALGAVYHMKYKSNDDQHLSFFGDNVITMAYPPFKAGSDANGDVDKFFRQYAELHENGVEADKCSENDCRFCSKNACCSFQADVEAEADDEESGEDDVIVVSRPEPKWTDGQKEFIETTEGINLVIAEAGSGKTAACVEKGARIIETDPENKGKLLFISFTDNSCGEIAERLLDRVRRNDPSADIEGVRVTTFHGFAFEFIKRYSSELGFKGEPRVVNDVDAKAVVDKVIGKKRLTGAASLYDYDFYGVINATGVALRAFNFLGVYPEADANALRRGMNADDADVTTISTCQELIDAYPEFLEELKARNIIRYDDMEPMFHRILEMHPEALTESGIEYVIIDEFQDVSDIQMETVKALAHMPQLKMLDMVGDPGQSIYAFRNANVENILHCSEKLEKPVNEIYLAENFRSTQEILDAAKAELDLNTTSMHTSIIAANGQAGKTPVIRGFHSEKDASKFIADEMIRVHEEGTPWKEICYQCHNGRGLVRMASALSQRGIPYILRNPMKFKDNSRVKAICKLVRNIYYQPETNAGYFAYLVAISNGRLMEENTPAEIQAALDKMSADYGHLEDMDERIQREKLHGLFEDIRGNDDVYAAFLNEYVYTYIDFEDEIRFFREFELFGANLGKKVKDDGRNAVQLVTAHSGKGLEWDVVFVDVTDFDSLSIHGGRHREELEETRRLLYVAMTRARKELTVIGQYEVEGTKSRPKKDGGVVYNQFLDELYGNAGLPWDPVDHEADAKRKARAKAAADKRKANALAVKSDEMTPEQKAAYNKAVRGSFQTCLKIS